MDRFCRVLLGCAGFVVACPAGGASFTGVGDLPGGLVTSHGLGISPDGGTVVGSSRSSSGNEPFVWTAAGGMQGLGDLPTGTFGNFNLARAASVGGEFVVGSGSPAGRTEATRWSAAGGLQGLGNVAGGNAFSSSWDVSADGGVVVGEARSGLGIEAFRWTQAGGLQVLGDLPGGGYSAWASGVSADGATVVGESQSANGLEAFLWTASGGMQGLGDLAGGGFDSRARDISAGGQFVVGVSESAEGNEAFLWTQAGGMRGLGDLPGGGNVGPGPFSSSAHGVSADGGVVVGQGFSDDLEEAFIWTEADGMRPLKAVLEGLGLAQELDGWHLTIAVGVSDDGTTIAGGGINPSGRPEGWVAVVPEPGSMAVLAAGVAGLLFRRRRG